MMKQWKGKPDVIVAGAGFAGAVAAREMVEAGKQVLVLEKRDHIGGNMYEEENEAGIRIHVYGPHIFHTNDEKVFHYIRQFGQWDTGQKAGSKTAQNFFWKNKSDSSGIDGAYRSGNCGTGTICV